jgi:hypothetical protein
VAKRKSTTKTSANETDDAVDATGVTEAQKSADVAPADMDAVADAVEALDSSVSSDQGQDAPADSIAAESSEDVIELAEPKAADEVADVPRDDTQGTDAIETTPSDDGPSDHTEKDDVVVETIETDPVGAENDTFERPEPAPALVAPQVVRETVVEHKGGFVPMLLGGAVAAVLGYGVAAYVSQNAWPFMSAEDDTFATETRAALATQDDAMAGLSDRLTALEGVEPPSFDLTPVESQIAAVQETTDELAARLDEMLSRIDTLEKQPMEQAVSPEAIAAYERALADLQAEVEAQREEVSKMAQEAIQAEGNAAESAQLAATRSAMAEVTAALETRSGFADALAVLTANGVAVPDALATVADSGVATQQALIEGFPDVARKALSAVRVTETEGSAGVNRITTFFANQLGARSVSPREGDDADAILSRAEAALRSGDLSAALSELSSMPDVAQSALADWQNSAQTRLEAKTAADALVQQLLQ